MSLFVLLLIFILGTLLLAKTKHERHSIIFMIRTRHFLNMIDSLANIMPGLWKFIADLAIVLSFSGIGAAYLSKHRKGSKNLDVIMFILGVPAILIWAEGLPMMALLVACMVAGIIILHKLENTLLDFVSATALISSIFISVLPWYMAILAGSFGILALVAGSLVEHAFDIASGESNMPGVSPIIPWIESGQWGFIIPGLGIFVPLGYGIISLILLLGVHEFGHGILARVHKLELKSTGLLTLGIIPIGAFVEPDEEKFNKCESIAKMRVLSMGSFANLILAILAIILFISLILPSNGWVVVESNITGIEKGLMVLAIDDINLSSSNHVAAMMDENLFTSKSYSLKKEVFENKSIINITTDVGVFALTPDELPGIRMKYAPKYRFNYEFLGFNLAAVLVGASFWIFFFNFNIALVNLLPIVPFDGGKMVLEIMSVFNVSEKIMKNVVYGFLLIGLVILAINAYPLLYLFFDWLF